MGPPLCKNGYIFLLEKRCWSFDLLIGDPKLKEVVDSGGWVDGSACGWEMILGGQSGGRRGGG